MKQSYGIMITKSVFGGMLISLGGIAFLLSDLKIVGSILFSIGLLTIIYFQQLLFTGALCKDIGSLSVVQYIVIYLGNCLGTIIVASIMKFTRLYNVLYEKVSPIVSIKSNDSFISLFILGILCEVCIYIAVVAKSRCESLSPLFIIFGVTIFVFCGFEHCIADCFYIFLADTGYSIMIPVTLGNIFCGLGLSCIRKLMSE